MNIIKLDAIDSTNTYLKEYVRVKKVENFTTVTAESQTKGRGQMGSSWNSEKGKNLTFSTFTKNIITKPEQIFDLNCLVTVTLLQVFKTHKIKNLAIKWPNDILADSKKVVGILIENMFKANAEIQSIIGIGINVNQKDFFDLEKATSLALELGIDIDKDSLLHEILSQLKLNFNFYLDNGADYFWEIFHDNLFRKNCRSTFYDNLTKITFEGVILGVNKQGMLEIKTNNIIKTYGLKEVSLHY